ncbi:MAG TPA: DNA ligase D [Candidatus Omnitrophota bacterium]|nr:DNA ligase D [Candidatus Omnitrophota bacterium]
MSPTGRSQLEKYREKRDPSRTPEPFGEAPVAEAPAGPGPRFVVQKHWARAMHYDLRLELDGTLKSWAVPKGPSTHVEEKRLAVHVEDHPLEYANFEGVIPSGNYGAGSVIVWDRGWFRSFKPEDPLEQYERGKLELELFGFKLRGRWTLVRMGKKDKEWLLLKKADDAATKDEAIDRYPESVISGLTVEEMRDVTGTVEALRDRVHALGAPRGDLDPKEVPLTLATPESSPPKGDDWSFEIKYDGVRVRALRDEDRVVLIGRSGEDVTKRYPEIGEALTALAVPRFLVDGEIIAEDERGHPSFQRLQARMGLTKPRDVAAARIQVPVRAIFFDALEVLGHDVRGLPLRARQELLARVLPPLATAQRSAHIVGNGAAFFAVAGEMGLEGIVGKRLESKYAGRRTPDWVKVKCDRRQEFVIGGFTEGERSGFGALHVGVYEGPKLVYVTKVGTGFDDAKIGAIRKLLDPLARETSPFDEGAPTGRGHRWAEPRLVCEVRFTEWTRDGGLRHPTFMGMRDDKKPEEVHREDRARGESAGDPPGEVALPPGDPMHAAEGTAVTDAKPAAGARRKPLTPGARAAAAQVVHITNPKKVFWPDGTTKGDLVAYYEAVAPLLLPYLRDRPVVLTRYPDGIEGKSFFQKDAPVYVPDWVRTQVVPAGGGERDIRYFVIEDLESLRYVANLGTIPLHVWSARASSLEHPDWMVLDLDPKEAPFVHVVQVARALKTILDRLELPSAIKTSGATGLHVLVPMGARYTHEESRTFARLLAMLTVEAVPEISTVTRAIGGRSGKVYVDFGQNGRGNTIVSPYSVRPRPGATASCPLRWDEVTPRLDPAKFTIRTIPERFREMEDPMTMVLGPGVDMAAAIAAIQKGMKS